MARSELAFALARSTAPVPDPQGIVRVPLTGYVQLAGILGAYLGMFLGPALFLFPPLSNLPKETREWLVPLAMVVGIGPGVLVTWASARRRSEGRAIAFDAAHIWIEARGEFADPLPWTGLRVRGGRIPHLVAEDGRAIPFQREAMGRSPEARYLAALVARLPKSETPPRVPTVVLAIAVIVGFVLASNARGLQPPLDAEGEFWSPQRLQSLAMLIVGATLAVGAGLWLFVRYGNKAEERAPRPSRPERPGSEIAAYFRAHRFRPPAIPLVAGVTYRYRDEAFWRAGVKSQREGRITLAGFGVVVFLLSLGVATLSRNDPPGRGPGPGGLVVLGAVNLILFGSVALFARPAPRAGMRLRIEGDEVLVSGDGFPERTFPWPPVRTHEAVESYDWTDELREGRRRLQFDRRLLVEASPDDAEAIV